MATDDELPGATAVRLAKVPPASGWTARATYAAGFVGDELHSSVVVRLRHRDGHAALAVWTDGEPDFGLVRPAGLPWWHPCGVSGVARAVKAVTPPRRKRGAPPPADPYLLGDERPEPEDR